jgi:hypothetical protein
LAAGVPGWLCPVGLDPATGRRDAKVVAVAESALVAVPAPAPGLPVAGPGAAVAVPALLEGAEATVES